MFLTIYADIIAFSVHYQYLGIRARISETQAAVSCHS